MSEPTEINGIVISDTLVKLAEQNGWTKDRLETYVQQVRSLPTWAGLPIAKGVIKADGEKGTGAGPAALQEWTTWASFQHQLPGDPPLPGQDIVQQAGTSATSASTNTELKADEAQRTAAAHPDSGPVTAPVQPDQEVIDNAPTTVAQGLAPSTNAPFEIWTGQYKQQTSQQMDDAGAPHYGTPQGPQPGMPSDVQYDSGQRYEQQQLAGMDSAAIKHLQKTLYTLNYYNGAFNGTLGPDTITAYDNLLRAVALQTQVTGIPITPEQFIKDGLGNKKPGDDPTSGSSGSSAKPHTNTSVEVTSEGDARALAIQEFTDKLGRRPKPQEIAAFTSALQAYEKSHPTVQHYDPTHGGGSDVVTNDGAASPQAYAEQYLDQNYGQQEGSNDALHFYNMAMQTLTGPIGSVHEVV